MPRGTRWRENKVVPGRVAAISAKDTDRNPRVTPRPAQGPAHATVNLLAPSVHCSLLSVARPSSTFHPLAFLSSFHPPLFTFPTFPSLAPLLSFFFSLFLFPIPDREFSPRLRDETKEREREASGMRLVTGAKHADRNANASSRRTPDSSSRIVRVDIISLVFFLLSENGERGREFVPVAKEARGIICVRACACVYTCVSRVCASTGSAKLCRFLFPSFSWNEQRSTQFVRAFKSLMRGEREFPPLRKAAKGGATRK